MRLSTIRRSAGTGAAGAASRRWRRRDGRRRRRLRLYDLGVEPVAVAQADHVGGVEAADARPGT